MDILHFILMGLTAAAAAFYIRERFKSDRIQAQLAQKETAIKEHLVAKARLEVRVEGLQTQLNGMAEVEKRMTAQFENLSSKILKEHQDNFSRSSADRIEHLIKPYQATLENFNKTFTSAHEQRIRESEVFKQHMNQMAEMNGKLSADANNLTRALRMNPKMRGNWGETILESLLENSGLSKGYHYRREVTGNNDEHQLRADVIIDLPGDRNLVIDSKVSLNHYYDYLSHDEDDGQNLLKDHVSSIRKHIDTLHRKQYDKMYDINSPDIVFMFVPVEAGLMAALQSDPELSNYATNRKVMLVTNSTLFAMLSVVSQLWQRDKQFRNSEKIAEEAGKLHTQVIAFVRELEKVGKSLDNARDSYQNATSRLTSGNNNVVRLTQRIEQLGAKVKNRTDRTLDKYEDLVLEKAC